MVEVRWSWTLQGSPQALWPWVSDTDFINQAAGLAAVQYAWEQLPHGGRRRMASSRLGPLSTRWVEQPFDWVEGEGLGVAREFLGGPVRSYRSEVRLQAEGEGQTRLTHTIRLTPRLGLLSPFVRWSVVGLESGFERAYRAAEAAAKATQSDQALGAPHPGALAALGAQGVPLPLAQRLAAWLLHGPARQVEQLRPFALADAWGLPRAEVLGACLAGLRGGVMQAKWALRCPHCMGAKGVAQRLQDLDVQAACEDCQASFGASLDQNAELLLAPHPSVRLPQTAIYCVAGPGATKHVLAQGLLAPGENKLLDLLAPPGGLVLRRGTQAVAHLTHDPQGPAGVVGPFDVAAAEPTEAHSGGDRLQVALVNRSERPVAYALAADGAAEAPCVVAQAVAHPDFGRSFPGEALAQGKAFALNALTVLAWKGPAPSEEEAHRHGGFLALGLGGQPLWAFYDPLDAIKAALAQDEVHRAWALEVGPAVLTGHDEDHGLGILSGGAPEAAVAEAAAAAPGSLVLSPFLADEPALRFQLMLGGWVEQGPSALGGLVLAPEALAAPGAPVFGG